VLPLAGRLEAPIRVRLVGGTDVKWSPSTDYLREVKLPLLRECGLDAAVDVRQRGFYPSGGGELADEIRPSTLSPIAIPDQTATESGVSQLSARAVATQDLEAADVADRMAETAAETLDDGFEAATVNAAARYVDADSTGAIVTLVAAGDTDGGPPRGNEGDGAGHPRRRAGFVAHGERGVPAEDVASAAVEAATEWGRNDAPIDEHLGDQLVVWLARCGGQVRVPRVTDHVRTNVELVRAFGYDVALESTSEDAPATLSAAESR
jgi:RNA 3'-terminal phosphate cyclase (ATP)